jgi:hypothetical protein
MVIYLFVITHIATMSTFTSIAKTHLQYLGPLRAPRNNSKHFNGAGNFYVWQLILIVTYLGIFAALLYYYITVHSQSLAIKDMSTVTNDDIVISQINGNNTHVLVMTTSSLSWLDIIGLTFTNFKAITMVITSIITCVTYDLKSYIDHTHEPESTTW